MGSTVAPLHFDCASCGAHVAIDGSSRMVTCTYCKTEMLLPDAIWAELHPTPAPAPAPMVVVTSGAPGRSLVFWITLICVLLPLAGTCVAVIAITASVGAKVTAKPVSTNPIASPFEPCNGRRAACSSDGKVDLVCGPGDKMVVEQTCKGPGACRASPDGASITCDATLGDVNDPCNITDDACSTDHRSELRCQAGRFTVISTCKGPDGCTLTPLGKGKGYTLSCDDHVADVGDPCFSPDRMACSSDKRSLLACTAQRFAVHQTCKRGCKVKKVVGTGNDELDCP